MEREKLERDIINIQRSTRTLIPSFVPLHNFLRMRSRFYYSWHLNPKSAFVHWIVLSLYVPLISAFVGWSILFGPLKGEEQAVKAATAVNIAVGSYPSAVAVNPITNKIYVANMSSNNVPIINGPDNAVATVSTGKWPGAVAVNPVTNKIYVANNGDNNVTIINGSDNSTATVSAGDYPNAIAINPITNKIYVVNNSSSNLTAINGSDNSTATVSLGASPSAIALNVNTNKIYVANNGDNNVTVVNGTDNSTTTVNAGSSPRAIAVNPGTNKIYVANCDSDNVTVINGSDNSTTNVSAGDYPVAVAVNPNTGKIYVANASSDNVTVINGSDNSTTNVDVGRWAYPNALAINPNTNKVYVANLYSSPTVSTIIDGSDNTTTQFTTGSQPIAIAVNPTTNKVYTANNDSGDVTVATESGESISLLSTTIGSFGSNTTSSVSPAFSGTATTTRPNSQIKIVGIRVDTLSGAWTMATLGAGTTTRTWTATLPAELTTGSHTLYAVPMDDTAATTIQLSDPSYIGNVQSYVFSVQPEVAPLAPASFNITPASTTQFAYSWSRASENETGFKILDESDVQKSTAIAGSASASESDLSPNTSYTRKVQSYNGAGSASSDTVSKYTLIEAPSGATFEDVTAASITIKSQNAPSNLSAGESGVLFQNVTAGTESGWIKTNSWTSSSLSPGMTYTFRITTRNGDGTTATPLEVSRATLAAATPEAATTETQATAQSIDAASSLSANESAETTPSSITSTNNSTSTTANTATSPSTNSATSVTPVQPAQNETTVVPAATSPVSITRKELVKQIRASIFKNNNYTTIITIDNSIRSLATQNKNVKLSALAVLIRDENNQPIANKAVELHSSTRYAITDDDGMAVFRDVAVGEHQLSYFDKKQGEIKVAINIEVPQIKIKRAEASGEVSLITNPIVVIIPGEKIPWYWWLMLAIVLIVNGALFYYYRSKLSVYRRTLKHRSCKSGNDMKE